MLEKLFAAYQDKPLPAIIRAYDAFIEAHEGKNLDDGALSTFMYEVERTAYRRGVADGIALMQEAAAARQQAG